MSSQQANSIGDFDEVDWEPGSPANRQDGIPPCGSRKYKGLLGDATSYLHHAKHVYSLVSNKTPQRLREGEVEFLRASWVTPMPNCAGELGKYARRGIKGVVPPEGDGAVLVEVATGRARSKSTGTHHRPHAKHRGTSQAPQLPSIPHPHQPKPPHGPSPSNHRPRPLPSHEPRSLSQPPAQHHHPHPPSSTPPPSIVCPVSPNSPMKASTSSPTQAVRFSSVPRPSPTLPLPIKAPAPQAQDQFQEDTQGLATHRVCAPASAPPMLATPFGQHFGPLEESLPRLSPHASPTPGRAYARDTGTATAPACWDAQQSTGAPTPSACGTVLTSYGASVTGESCSLATSGTSSFYKSTAASTLLASSVLTDSAAFAMSHSDVTPAFQHSDLLLVSKSKVGHSQAECSMSTDIPCEVHAGEDDALDQPQESLADAELRKLCNAATYRFRDNLLPSPKKERKSVFALAVYSPELHYNPMSKMFVESGLPNSMLPQPWQSSTYHKELHDTVAARRQNKVTQVFAPHARQSCPGTDGNAWGDAMYQLHKQGGLGAMTTHKLGHPRTGLELVVESRASSAFVGTGSHRPQPSPGAAHGRRPWASDNGSRPPLSAQVNELEEHYMGRDRHAYRQA